MKHPNVMALVSLQFFTEQFDLRPGGGLNDVRDLYSVANTEVPSQIYIKTMHLKTHMKTYIKLK